MELVIRRITLPSKDTLIVAPLGDIQWAGRREQIAHQMLKDHIAHVLDRGGWFFGMGDYIDFSSPSNRQRLKAAALYDTAEMVIADKARELTDELYEEYLSDTKGRWIGLLEGHHWSQLMTGQTTDQYLADKLQCPFLGTSAYVGLQWDLGTYGHRIITLWAHHGAGGGQKTHAPLLKLENLLPYWDADIFLIGHMTKQAAAPVSRVFPVWTSKVPVLRDRKVYLVGTGGWLKGYEERSRHGTTPRGGYVEAKMLNPVQLGAPIVTIRPKIISPSTRIRSAHERRDVRERIWTPEIKVEI